MSLSKGRHPEPVEGLSSWATAKDLLRFPKFNTRLLKKGLRTRHHNIMFLCFIFTNMENNSGQKITFRLCLWLIILSMIIPLFMFMLGVAKVKFSDGVLIFLPGIPLLFTISTCLVFVIRVINCWNQYDAATKVNEGVKIFTLMLLLTFSMILSVGIIGHGLNDLRQY